MVELANNLNEGGAAALAFGLLLAISLAAMLTLLDRWAIVGGLGVAYLSALLLMQGAAPIAAVILTLATGFFVLIILGMSLRQANLTSTILTQQQALSLPLRLISALVALTLVWLAVQLVKPLPPLPDYLLWPIFALCGLGLWLAFIGGALFRSAIGLLLFLTGLMLLTGSAQSSPIWLGVLGSLQLFVAIAVSASILRQAVDDRLGDSANLL